MDVTCNHCKKQFHIRPSFYKKNKTKVFYCCKQCMLDHKHIDKATVKCSTCGEKDNLHAHHIESLYNITLQYNMNLNDVINSSEFNNVNNGITLCSDCHALEHPFIFRDEKGRFCRPNSKPLKS